MRQNFFSRQELQEMPLGKLKRLVSGDGIQDQDEERLVNEIMDAKKGFAPMQQTVTLRKDLDIVTQQQEEKWERELESRKMKMRAQESRVVAHQPLDMPKDVASQFDVVEPELSTEAPKMAVDKPKTKIRKIKVKK